MFTLALAAVLLALFLPLPRRLHWLPFALVPLGLWPPVGDAVAVVPWQAPLVVLLLFPWWLLPIQFWRKGVQPARPVFSPYDPAAHAMGEDVEAAVEAYAAALGREGFARVGEGYREADGHHERLVLFEHPERPGHALVTAAEMRAGEVRVPSHQVSFSARFADGRTLTVTNQPLPTHDPPPLRREECFPQVRDPARLLRVFERCVERFYPGEAPVRVEHGGDVPAFLAGAAARYLDEQAARGRQWRRDGDVVRLTLRGALASWRLNFPLAPPNRLLEWNIAACTITAVLVMVAGPYAERIPGLGWLVTADAGEVRALLPGSEQVEVPDDFAVPADYAGAVRALERLAGTRAVRVIADDHGGTLTPTDAMEVHVDFRRADALVAAARERFAARGYLLFRRDADVSGTGLAARVVLWPRLAPYEAVRALQTNGWNQDVSPAMVEAWLRVLERGHPFTLTVIGFDEVGGEFAAQPTRDEAVEIAKKLHVFCPDVVYQGTGTVDVLVEEVMRDRSFYCWWD